MRGLRWSRRTTFRVVAVCAGCTSAFSVLQGLRNVHTVDQREGRRISVCVAARNISLGDVVNEDDCQHVERRANAVVSSAIRRADAIAGRVATMAVLRDDVLRDEQFAARDRTGIDGVVPSGMRLVEIPLANRLIPDPGTFVDVIAAFPPDASSDASLPVVVVARRVVVAARVGKLDDAQRADPAVRLIVTPNQAERLALAAVSGNLTLAVTPPDA
jgi:pilus assembly protein CpaB